MALYNTATSLKFQRLVRRLGIPGPYVLGHLEYLWAYGHQHATERQGPEFRRGDVEAVCIWQGEPGVLEDAMLEEEWLDGSQFEMWIHDFYEHTPIFVKKRIERLEREQRKNEEQCSSKTQKQGTVFPENTKNEEQCSQKTAKTGNVDQQSRVEKSRVEKSREEIGRGMQGGDLGLSPLAICRPPVCDSELFDEIPQDITTSEESSLVDGNDIEHTPTVKDSLTVAPENHIGDANKMVPPENAPETTNDLFPCDDLDSQKKLKRTPKAFDFDPLEVMQAWNEMAAQHPGMAQALELTKSRRTAINARMGESRFRSDWRDIIKRVGDSPWLTGDNDRGWRADFDWILNPKNYIKILEGRYSGTARKKPVQGISRPSDYNDKGEFLG